jgi:lipopolysaccharide export system protein LptC
MFFKSLWLNITLVLLIILGLGLIWVQSMLPSAKRSPSSKPDFYAVNVNILQTDDQGHPADRLTSPLLVHFPKDNHLQLSQPFFEIYTKNQENWQLSARYGRLLNDQDTLQLWEAVQLKQYHQKALMTTLKTTTLTLHLKKKTASTHAPVVITQANQVIHATGLNADLNKKTLQLLSDVQGQIKLPKH